MGNRAESAYRRASRHWKLCRQCSEAGGERAKLEDLCPLGRTLTEVWDKAEAAEAERAAPSAEEPYPHVRRCYCPQTKPYLCSTCAEEEDAAQGSDSVI